MHARGGRYRVEPLPTVRQLVISSVPAFGYGQNLIPHRNRGTYTPSDTDNYQVGWVFQETSADYYL